MLLETSVTSKPRVSLGFGEFGINIVGTSASALLIPEGSVCCSWTNFIRMFNSNLLPITKGIASAHLGKGVRDGYGDRIMFRHYQIPTKWSLGGPTDRRNVFIKNAARILGMNWVKRFWALNTIPTLRKTQNFTSLGQIAHGFRIIAFLTYLSEFLLVPPARYHRGRHPTLC